MIILATKDGSRVQTEYRIGRIFGRIFGPGIRPNTYSAFLNYSAEYQSLNLWRFTYILAVHLTNHTWSSPNSSYL